MRFVGGGLVMGDGCGGGELDGEVVVVVDGGMVYLV